MNSLFDLNNPVWRFIGKCFDACLLSFVWLICSLPIFTIGASTTALYYTFLKLVKDEESYLLKDFFKAFKQNFKQSTIIWFLLTILGIILFVDVFYYKFMPTTKGLFMYYFFWVLILFYIIINIYIYPLIAKFENNTIRFFKIAIMLSIKHFVFTTIMLFTCTVLVMISINIPPVIVFLPGLIPFFNSYILRHIFDLYIEKQEQN